MADIQLLRFILCPTGYGGCGRSDGWRVALGTRRVIMDCSCGYRLSLPLDRTGLEKGGNFQTVPLFYDENSTVKD